jgi:Na+-transporting methylmalonyl-CoA/oxaloacetate decarboxylase gamma subunit
VSRVTVKSSLPIIVHNLFLSGILAHLRGTGLLFLVLMMLVCEGRVIRQRLVASCTPLRPSAVIPELASSSNSNTVGTEWDNTAEFLLDYSSQIIKPSDAV